MTLYEAGFRRTHSNRRRKKEDARAKRAHASPWPPDPRIGPDCACSRCRIHPASLTERRTVTNITDERELIPAMSFGSWLVITLVLASATLTAHLEQDPATPACAIAAAVAAAVSAALGVRYFRGR
mgnify:CR=1 FL=1